MAKPQEKIVHTEGEWEQIGGSWIFKHHDEDVVRAEMNSQKLAGKKCDMFSANHVTPMPHAMMMSGAPVKQGSCTFETLKTPSPNEVALAVVGGVTFI